MFSISLVLPKLPNAFKELWSQFKKRKLYLLHTPVFEVPEDFHGNLGPDLGHCRIERILVEIVGSYGDRVIYSKRIIGHQLKYTTTREWADDEFKIVKVDDEKFILQNWPKLKARPFPGEDFFMVIRFPMNHKVKIPYIPIKR